MIMEPKLCAYGVPKRVDNYGYWTLYDNYWLLVLVNTCECSFVSITMKYDKDVLTGEGRG